MTEVAVIEAFATTKFSNVPVFAVTVLAVTAPFTDTPDATTDAAVIEASATTRFVKVPVSLVIADDVIPLSSGWVWAEDATVERIVAMSFTPEPVGFVPL